MNEGSLPIVYNRRWYDRIDNLSRAVQVSQHLPKEVQALIARSLNEAIDDQRRFRRNDKYALSLGYHRVLGLYKSSYRRRWYDPAPALSRAYNFMVTVPEVYLSDLASRILRIGQYVNEQQQQRFGHYDRYQLTNTVEGILRESLVEIKVSDGGIKLVGELGGNYPKHPRHMEPGSHVVPAHKRQQR